MKTKNSSKNSKNSKKIIPKNVSKSKKIVKDKETGLTDIPLYLPAKTTVHERFNEIRDIVRKPMITSSIDNKALNIVCGGLIKETDERNIYRALPLPNNKKEYNILIKRNKNGVVEYPCECQGYGEATHCCHSLALLIIRVINRKSNINELIKYTDKAKKIRKTIGKF